jgi:hypothetical protein
MENVEEFMIDIERPPVKRHHSAEYEMTAQK